MRSDVAQISADLHESVGELYTVMRSFRAYIENLDNPDLNKRTEHLYTALGGLIENLAKALEVTVGAGRSASEI